MGIDLLEDSDMSALSESRCGNGFVDEWENFVLGGVLLAKKKDAQTSKAYAQDAMRNLPELNDKMDCTAIDVAIDKAQAEMDARRGMITAGAKAKLQQSALSSLESYIARARGMKSSMQCEKIAEEEQRKQGQAETQNILQQVTAGATGGAQTPEEAAKSKQNKYIIYGIGGLLALGAIIVLLKPSK